MLTSTAFVELNLFSLTLTRDTEPAVCAGEASLVFKRHRRCWRRCYRSGSSVEYQLASRRVRSIEERAQCREGCCRWQGFVAYGSGISRFALSLEMQVRLTFGFAFGTDQQVAQERVLSELRSY